MVFGFVRSRFLSVVAFATAVVLGFSGFSAVDAGASVVAEPVDVLSASSSESFERGDSVSARVTARAVGRRVEDVSQRSAVEQVFANPDSSWTSEVSVLPRFRADGGGGFVPIEESGTSGRLRAVGGVVDGVRGYLYSNAVQTAFEGSRKARNPRKGSGKWYKSQVRKIQSIKPKIRSYRAYAF